MMNVDPNGDSELSTGSVLPGVGNIKGAVIGFVVGTVAGFVLEIEIGGKSIIDHIRDGVYNFWQWLFG